MKEVFDTSIMGLSCLTFVVKEFPGWGIPNNVKSNEVIFCTLEGVFLVVQGVFFTVLGVFLTVLMVFFAL